MKKYNKFDIRGNWTCNILVKPSVFVIYVLPIVLSVSLGTAVMAETLSSPDRELNFLQFGGDGYTSSSNTGLSLVGFNDEITQPIICIVYAIVRFIYSTSFILL